jgi:UDPglucose 6-dehydrogenase
MSARLDGKGCRQMQIVMVGTGYVGLVSGACFSEFGHDVLCVDKDAGKIAALEAGRIPIYEPGLDDLVARNVKAGRLRFSTDLAGAVPSADAVFLAVGTPSRRGDGHADLSYVFAAADEVGAAMQGYTLLVTKSTVPVGTGAQIEARLRAAHPSAQFDVASNPEFLREGSAIEDFMRPDRVVCGVESEQARAVLAELYRALSLRDAPLVFTSRNSAEVIKYAANAFLATKISFINEMADLCEQAGADVQDVARGIGMDKRIGAKFLHPGPGYGGSCFPKDTLALLRTGDELGVPLRIVRATVEVNDRRKAAMAERIIAACGGAVAGKTIGVLGLTFKPNTDDMRDAPSLVIVPALQAAGARIQAYDPEGMQEAQKLLPDIRYVDGPYAVAQGADALVLLTEWNQFRGLDLERLGATMVSRTLIDLRNVYAPSSVKAAGWAYQSVGR